MDEKDYQNVNEVWQQLKLMEALIRKLITKVDEHDRWIKWRFKYRKKR